MLDGDVTHAAHIKQLAQIKTCIEQSSSIDGRNGNKRSFEKENARYKSS